MRHSRGTWDRLEVKWFVAQYPVVSHCVLWTVNIITLWYISAICEPPEGHIQRDEACGRLERG